MQPFGRSAPTDASRADKWREPPSTPNAWLTWLYETHFSGLCAYLRRKYGAGPPDPEDVTQQAFLQVSRMSPSAVARVEHPKSFLYRVAENALISEMRKERTRAAHARDAHTAQFATESYDVDPESVLISRDELIVIEAAIRAMPERRRSCFLMNRMDDMSFAEIGRRLSISPTAARKHVERAMADIERAVDSRLEALS